MSHFLAVSLRTGELPHLSAGTGTSSGGGGVLLPVLPVSQGPGEAEWGLSWVAVLLRWGGRHEQVSGYETFWVGCPGSFRLAQLLG